MHRIRPYLGLTLYSLAGGAVGTGSVLAFRMLLAPYRLPGWALALIAGTVAVGLLTVAATVHQQTGRRAPRRRAHARPHPAKTRRIV